MRASSGAAGDGEGRGAVEGLLVVRVGAGQGADRGGGEGHQGGLALVLRTAMLVVLVAAGEGEASKGDDGEDANHCA